MSLVDLDTFKSYLKVNRGANPADDDTLQAALDAADSGINEALERHIAVADTVATARVYAPTRSPFLFIDDCVEVTSIVDDTYTLATSDYQLEPLNNRGRSGEYRPYSEIRRQGGWFDSGGWATVTVTAKWGWAQIPAGVTEGAKILAKDILANRDVNFGIAALTEYAGVRARSNPQVWDRIQPYSLHAGIG